MLRGLRALLSLGLIVTVAACATVPPRVAPSREEQIRLDNSAGNVLAAQFEPQLKMLSDIEVSVYLRQLTERMAAVTPELKDSPIGVFLISAKNGKWNNFALPGNRLYLSVSLLKRFGFENELAALIAYQLAHIMNRYALRRLEQRSSGTVEGDGIGISHSLMGLPVRNENVEFLGPSGVFAFSQQELLSSAEVAAGILYRAGIDPRGLIALWKNYEDNPGSSPFDGDTLERLFETTREAIALFSPLRNPVVRSEAFVKIQKRLERL